MWTYSESQEATTFLLALAARQRQLQYEPIKQVPDDSVDSDDAEDRFIDDAASHVADTGDDTQDVANLQKRFLDRFAELFACGKNSSFVSAAIMVRSRSFTDDQSSLELKQNFTIYVFRNNGFRPQDKTFFIDLGSLLSELALSMLHDRHREFLLLTQPCRRRQ